MGTWEGGGEGGGRAGGSPRSDAAECGFVYHSSSSV